MRHSIALVPLVILWTGIFAPSSGNPAKEFLTDKEIAQLRENQEIDLRLKIYMNAAKLRLKTAEERLTGNESVIGDPLEFFSPEDMLDGYYRILRSVMLILDEAFQKPGRDRGRVRGALKTLKGATEDAAKELEVLKRLAEEKKKEELWNLVNKAIDINNGAYEGAEYGLSKEPAPSEKKTKGK
jgi:hypothetical protein